MVPFATGERETVRLYAVNAGLKDGLTSREAVARAKRDVIEAGPEIKRERAAAYALERGAHEIENAAALDARLTAMARRRRMRRRSNATIRWSDISRPYRAIAQSRRRRASSPCRKAPTPMR